LANRFLRREFFGSLLLREDNEETYYHCEESSAFNESGSKDHVGTDITNSFWLTSDRLESRTTDAADTYTSAKSCNASTETGKTVSHTNAVTELFS
jgi:hypothetical protein